MKIINKNVAGYGMEYTVQSTPAKTCVVRVLFGRTTCSNIRCGANCIHVRFVLKNNAGDFAVFAKRDGN